MRKIPTIFLKDCTGDHRYVTSEPNPACAWVFAGEGTPTRKYDGQCVMWDAQEWWTRCSVARGGLFPASFRKVEHDETTGRTVGWRRAGRTAYEKPLHEAASEFPVLQLGTYELVGPDINGNPERWLRHHLIRHAIGLPGDTTLDYVQTLGSVPLGYDELLGWLSVHPYEGVVWYHPDGLRAKIKRSDYPGPGRTS